MGDVPIIFSAPMVQALIAGRKTMTRRLAYRSPNEKGAAFGRTNMPTPWQRAKPGDRLWVRESLTHVTSDPVTAQPCSVHCYTADVPPGMGSSNPYECGYLFAADGVPTLKPKGIPSIHMPRWASRLTLIVTVTKVEPLQALSEADAIAEGVQRIGGDMPWAENSFKDGPNFYTVDMGDGALSQPTAAGTFALLWKCLHGEDAWDANPEVVALTFRVIKTNIDAPEARVAA